MGEADPDQQTDEELMEAFAHGDDRAFNVLYARHSGRVYGYLRKRLGASPLVDEVFQESFLKLTRARRSFNTDQQFSPWFFSIVYHSMVDALRREKRTEALPEGEEPSSSANAPARLEAEGVLSGLTDREREVLALRFLEDLSFGAVAKRLDISGANARQIVSRALKKLRRSTA